MRQGFIAGLESQEDAGGAEGSAMNYQLYAKVYV